MDTQNTRLIAPVAGLAYCACCTPRQLLVPRDEVGTPGRWAVCPARQNWYENRGDGIFERVAVPGPAPAPAPPAWPQGIAPGDQWAGGDALPTIVPGVRIDLSRETYS